MGLTSAFLLAAALAGKSFQDAPPQVRVLAVGVNVSYRVGAKPLRFAEDDARRFAEAMRTVGLVPAVLARSLTGATLAEFRTAIKELGQGARGGKFVFYFSGHSDEAGLQLKDGLLSKDELHELLTAVEAPTKVAILDSCFSGAITPKGVEVAPAFELPRVEFDEPSGSVFLTASTARQMAFESDQLAGSVFTHHLLNGLYGEADGNGDGVVTVDELYQYVYRNTKWATLNHPASASQEPEYVARLSGQGAIMLSFPAQTNAPLRLGRDLQGEVTIASPRGIQFFKVEKEGGVEKTIQLPVGEYRISVLDGARVGEGEVDVRAAPLAVVAAAGLRWDASGEAPRAKGVVAPPLDQPADPDDGTWRLLMGAHFGYLDEPAPGPYAEVSLFLPVAGGGWLTAGVVPALGFHRTAVTRHANRGVALRTDTTAAFVDAEARAALPWRLSAVSVTAAVGLGEAYHDQRWDYGDERPAIVEGGATPAARASVGLGVKGRGGRVYGVKGTIEGMRAAESRGSRAEAGGDSLALTVAF